MVTGMYLGENQFTKVCLLQAQSQKGASKIRVLLKF